MKVDIVIPTYNEEEGLGEFYTQLKAELAKLKDYSFSIVFVDDGSSDKTLQIIKRIKQKDARVHYVSFSRNFGHQAALRAGLAESKGDAAISMDADLQHPPELISQLIKYWREGFDIVYTRRQSGKDTGLMKRFTSNLFYRLLNRLSGLNMDEGAADFRLTDKSVTRVINDLTEPNLFLRGFIVWSGFTTHAIDYQSSARFAGTSKYSLRKMFSLALHGVTQFSIKPLRLANILGFMSALVGVLYGAYAAWSFMIHKAVISGWTSVIISVLVLGGIQLIMLGIIGEYLGRTFMQTKARPDYIIKEQA